MEVAQQRDYRADSNPCLPEPVPVWLYLSCSAPLSLSYGRSREAPAWRLLIPSIAIINIHQSCLPPQGLRKDSFAFGNPAHYLAPQSMQGAEKEALTPAHLCEEAACTQHTSILHTWQAPCIELNEE